MAKPANSAKPTKAPTGLEKYVDGNPKSIYGIQKPPLFYTPMRAVYLTAAVHLQGALKYGHFNWRMQPVTASTYIDAALRHIMAYKEGEQVALDTGLPHLAHAAACLNILMDAYAHGTLKDDRHEQTTNMEGFFENLSETVRHIYAEWGSYLTKDVEVETAGDSGFDDNAGGS